MAGHPEQHGHGLNLSRQGRVQETAIYRLMFCVITT